MSNEVHYYDRRSCDRFVITTDHLGKFLSARRYIEGGGQRPTNYDSLHEVPEMLRHDLIQACFQSSQNKKE